MWTEEHNWNEKRRRRATWWCCIIIYMIGAMDLGRAIGHENESFCLLMNNAPIPFKDWHRRYDIMIMMHFKQKIIVIIQYTRYDLPRFEATRFTSKSTYHRNISRQKATYHVWHIYLQYPIIRPYCMVMIITIRGINKHSYVVVLFVVICRNTSRHEHDIAQCVNIWCQSDGNDEERYHKSRQKSK
jgi:hypothetical protein